MSRGYSERHTAWEVWTELNKREGHTPTAYVHGCGAAGDLLHVDLGNVVCPGCGFELGRPESDCVPLYRLGGAS